MKNLIKREAMSRAERQYDRVFGRRCLQLEVELAAETLSKRQPPGAIQSASKRRVNHHLLRAALVKKAFDHQRLLRGHHPERDVHGDKLFDYLFSGRR